MSSSLLLQLGPYAAVIATFLSIWRFGIKPKFDKAEADAVSTTKWRTEIDSFRKSQEPLNKELIEIARWKISVDSTLTQYNKDVDKIVSGIDNLRTMVERGNRDSTEQHNKMRDTVDVRCRELSDKIEKIKHDIYTK